MPGDLATSFAAVVYAEPEPTTPGIPLTVGLNLTFFGGPVKAFAPSAVAKIPPPIIGPARLASVCKGVCSTDTPMPDGLVSIICSGAVSSKSSNNYQTVCFVNQDC